MAVSAPLPRRAIAPRERLVAALDVASPDAARRLVERLGDAVWFYKLGFELAAGEGYFALADELVAAGKRVFLDLKLYDIPETVAAAVRRLRERGASFVTVHYARRVLEAACREKGPLGILAVTLLTSFDRADLRDLGYPESTSPEELVLARARGALEAGCDGVVASPLEARRLRTELGPGLVIVTPGIRPETAPAAADDQRRIATPRAAFEAGADYIVVGRPIRAASDPRAAALAIQATIAERFG
jgi:orotidine-5'-phosphate decarboxylase